MNCDRIARCYGVIEWFAFGQRLQRSRLAFLAAAQGKRRALVLGDGDGRFTKALAVSYPNLEIHSIELSVGMIAAARKRLGARISITQGDVLQVSFPPAAFDIVFTHFLLDCFSSKDLQLLINRVSKALNPDAIWVLSDFRQATSGWQSLYTKAWLVTMYSFFACVTGLKTRTLPDYEAALTAGCFSKYDEQISRDGLICSQCWQRDHQAG